MEVRRRLPRERSYVHERQETAPVLDTAAANTGHGVFNGLLALLGYLVQLLTSIVYGASKTDTRQKEDVDEDKSNQETILLGYMCRGVIAVHERRRKRSTALVLSSSRHGETPSALRHAAAVWVLVLAIQDISHGTVQISKGSFYLLVCLCNQFLFGLDL